MPLILVTNDDGYRSEGIAALAEALAPLGEVTIVAPDRGSERDRPRADAAASAAARADRRSRLRRRRHADRLREHRDHAGVQAAARSRRLRHQQGLEPRRRCDVFGDGGGRARRGAARRAEHGGVAQGDARRVRLQPRGAGGRDAGRGGAARGRCRRGRFSTSTCRKGQPKGFRVTVQAKRNHITSVAERHDPKGRPYYWIEEGQDEWQPHDRSDYQAVRDGYVSVTPLQPDLTAHSALAAVEELCGVRESADRVLGLDRRKVR